MNEYRLGFQMVRAVLAYLMLSTKGTRAYTTGSRYTDRLQSVLQINSDNDLSSVLPRLLLQGAAPCPLFVTPCPFEKAEMTPCPFE